LSVTVAVKFDVPVAVGVPEIMPVVAARVSPAGSVPAVIDHVYPGVPPFAVMGFEYAVPTAPEGSVALIANAGGAVVVTAIESWTDFVCTGLPVSVAFAVKLAVPVAVGVPEMTPDADASVSPAGRLPAVIDQAYGVVPPPACSEVE
jgi:hypothetical protein